MICLNDRNYRIESTEIFLIFSNEHLYSLLESEYLSDICRWELSFNTSQSLVFRSGDTSKKTV